MHLPKHFKMQISILKVKSIKKLVFVVTQKNLDILLSMDGKWLVSHFKVAFLSLSSLFCAKYKTIEKKIQTDIRTVSTFSSIFLTCLNQAEKNKS